MFTEKQQEIADRMLKDLSANGYVCYLLTCLVMLDSNFHLYSVYCHIPLLFFSKDIYIVGQTKRHKTKRESHF